MAAVDIGVGKNLWDICWLAHPSGDIYLFIYVFYEYCKGYTAQYFADYSLFRVYSP